MRDRQTLISNLKPADWVILLAAEHKEDVVPVSLYYDINVDGARNVLEAMEAKGINKLLFVSSVSVYGLNQSQQDETDSVAPYNDYGKSKWMAEELMRTWQATDPHTKRSLLLDQPLFLVRATGAMCHQLLQQVQSGKFVMVGNGNNHKIHGLP